VPAAGVVITIAIARCVLPPLGWPMVLPSSLAPVLLSSSASLKSAICVEEVEIVRNPPLSRVD
jgi:hypothetical protein